MGAAGRARAEGLLAWAHQERSLLSAYSRALGAPGTGARGRKERRAPGVDEHMSTIEAQPDIDFGASPFPSDVGAVILGGDYQGLGIVRSLGRRGVPVSWLTMSGRSARLSPLCELVVVLCPVWARRADVVAILLRIAAVGLDGWVLYPTQG